MTLGSLVISRTSMTSGSLLLSSQLQHLEVPHGFVPLGAGLGTVFSGPEVRHGHLGDSAPLKTWYLSGMRPLSRIPVSPHPMPWDSQPLCFTSGLTEMGSLSGSQGSGRGGTPAPARPALEAGQLSGGQLPASTPRTQPGSEQVLRNTW